MAAQQLKFVTMPDGRRVAYRELGCRREDAERSLLVMHGLMSSRRVAMPGASEDLVKKYGLRLVAIDRPGYGQSDPHPAQTFRTSSMDIASIIDALSLGQKIWLLGFSMGGAYCWAAARYLPHRIAGIGMVSPIGNFWWKGIPEEDQQAIVGSYSATDHLISAFCKFSPFPLIQCYAKFLSKQLLDKSADVTSGLSPPDRKYLQRPEIADYMFRDRFESLNKNEGFGIAKDYELLNKGWDFDLADINRVFKGPIHIWQGDEDTVVPLRLQQCAQKLLPQVMHLHELRGEGHFSWFCFNPSAPEEILRTLFGEDMTDKQRLKAFSQSPPLNTPLNP
eukprot:c20352_g1_i1 orf=169-1173(+)